MQKQNGRYGTIIIFMLGWVLLLTAISEMAPSQHHSSSGWPLRPEVAAAAPASAFPALAITPAITLTEVITNLQRPVDITHAGDGRLFIVEKAGRIRIFDGATLLPTPFLDISSLVDDVGNEQGLLGLAFHPDYTSNGYFYINYTYDPGPGLDRTRIARYSVSAGNTNVADPASAVTILEVAQDFINHNGGDLNFGPNDGYLYIGMGDGGDGGDPNDRAQDNTQLLGKMLRIDVAGTGGADCDASGGNNYAIPADNPFVNVAGCAEIWTSGLRNPWRFSFDRSNGDMWIGDVGQGGWEEINFQPATSAGGENWGWRCYEGDHAYNTSGCQAMGTYDFPVAEYSRTDGNCAVTGGFVYRGTAVPALAGHYLFADYCSHRFWSLNGPSHALAEFGLPNVVGGSLGNVTTFGEDINGELYVAEDGTGASVFKITAVAHPCMDDVATVLLPLIFNQANQVKLTWTHEQENSGGYTIHRSEMPYFMPATGNKVATLTPGSETYTDPASGIGNSTINHNYIIQSRNCDGSSTAATTAVAEFDWPLSP